MDAEKLEQLFHTISKGNTMAAEALFKKPGGRKYFEHIILVLVCNLPYSSTEKEDLFIAFRKALDKIEKRIKRQPEGQMILDEVYR